VGLTPALTAIRFFFMTPLSLLWGAILYMALSSSLGAAQTSILPGVKEGHCSEIRGNADNTTLACLVWDRRPENFSEPRQIQIYRKDEQPQTIESGEPIREWHFWSNGRQLAIHFGEMGTSGNFALYDLASEKQVERVSGVSGPSGLPQWAKSPSQMRDESVPEGPTYIQQRTDWIAKVLDRLDNIHPGMTRKDLDHLVTTEGGLSTRLQRTYVFIDCPYIKVDVHFKAVAGTTNSHEENPEDVVESVSKPYLEFSHAD
jgi:hypothetical protein